MRKLDASLPLDDVKTMETQIRENVAQDRIISTLSLAFALLATVLAAIGLYGVLAYTVAQRTREFGLRMALGADGGAVRGMVMKQVARMAVVGGVIGMAIADRRRPARQVAAVRDGRPRSAGARRRHGRAGAGRARRRLHSRPARVEDRSDECACATNKFYDRSTIVHLILEIVTVQIVEPQESMHHVRINVA